MTDSTPDFNTTPLWTLVRDRTQHALDCGALQPIPTDCDYLEQDGIRFLVRTLANLERKAKAQKKQRQQTRDADRPFDPFLPYEDDLFVADLSPTHVCLLNKYNVVEHHLLMVTRAFEPQNTWLTEADFAALRLTLAQIDGLGFYNGGTAAGASQPHKHLQLVPFPLVPAGMNLPIDPAIAAVTFPGESGMGRSPLLPFSHAIARVSLAQEPSQWLAVYHRLLAAVGILEDAPNPSPTSPEQTTPYNLLATRDWLMVVPRSREGFEGISINSLGFAGALLVRNEEQMARLKARKPLQVLAAVAL